jgi:hypothetical protein
MVLRSVYQKQGLSGGAHLGAPLSSLVALQIVREPG